MTCWVDHDARRFMGLLRCYECEEELQTIEEANAIRERGGMSHLFGPDAVLYRAEQRCPTCLGKGWVSSALAEQEVKDGRL